ncbi:MAG: helix-turn-helix domain-containing protein [Armatimonadota bacterium]
MPFCNFALHASNPDTQGYPLELKTLGDHLKKKRLDLGLVQTEVANILGVSEGTLVNWERNQAEPEFQRVPQIISFLGYLPFNNIMEKPLGEKIWLLQQLYGINQKTLARRLGVDPCTLYKWARGKGWPKVKEINGMLSGYIDKWKT